MLGPSAMKRPPGRSKRAASRKQWTRDCLFSRCSKKLLVKTTSSEEGGRSQVLATSCDRTVTLFAAWRAVAGNNVTVLSQDVAKTWDRTVTLFAAWRAVAGFRSSAN